MQLTLSRVELTCLERAVGSMNFQRLAQAAALDFILIPGFFIPVQIQLNSLSKSMQLILLLF